MTPFAGPRTSDRPVAGIAAIVIGLFLFSLQDVIIKGFSDRYSVLQIVFVRAVVALTIMLIAVLWTSGSKGLIPRSPRLLLLKGLCGFLSYATYYLAIASMPLAAVVSIVFIAPIFVTVLSALLLEESVGPHRWSAVVVGFAGVVIVVGPSGHIRDIASVLALFAAITYAASSLITRYIGAEDEPWTISFYSMLVFLVASSLASAVITALGVTSAEHPSMQFLLRPWSVPETPDAALMVFLGINAAAGFYLLTRAYWIAPPSLIAPFEYTYIVWAVLFGYLIWAEVPKPTTLLGVAMLIGSSLYILRRELVARNDQASAEIARGAADRSTSGDTVRRGP